MKKVILFVLSACLVCQLHAEVPYRHHVSASVGVLTNRDLGAFVGAVVPAFFGLGEPQDINPRGSYNLSYDYSFARHWSVGVSGGVNYNSYKFRVVTSDEFKQYNNRYIFVMPHVICRWFRRDRVSLYSSAAAGVEFFRETDEEGVAFTWQVNAFGVEYFFGSIGSGRHFGFFAETGNGSQGMVNVGLRSRF